MALVGIVAEANQLEGIASKLAEYDSVSAVIMCTGRYDIIAPVFARDMAYLSEFLIREVESFSGVVAIENMVVFQIKKWSHALLTSEEDFSVEVWGPPPGHWAYPELDPLEMALIRELDIDGRRSIVDLANRLRKSTITIRKKLNGLVNGGIIRLVGVASAHALGYNATALIGINTRPGHVESVADELTTCKNVHTVVLTSGRYQLYIWAVFRDRAHLSEFLLDRLANDPGIVRSETMLNLQIRKVSFSHMVTGSYRSDPSDESVSDTRS